MTLAQRLTALVNSIGAKIKDLRSKVGNLANLNTTTKTDLVSAINEVKNSTALIDDAQTVANKTWSSSKIDADATAKANAAQTAAQTFATSAAGAAETAAKAYADTVAAQAEADAATYTDNAVAASKASILGGASAAYDTLVELEAAVVANGQGVGALVSAIGDRVSYTQNDGKTAAEMLQACNNIGVGNYDQDLVAVLDAALV